MSDNVLVSNAPASVNPDIPVRTTETVDAKHIQHMRLDIGSGTSESVVTGSNPFPTLSSGTIVASNSSISPLTGGGVFTGAAMEITNYAVINVCVYSDVASATNGLTVQFSPDGTNWDHSLVDRLGCHLHLRYSPTQEMFKIKWLLPRYH